MSLLVLFFICASCVWLVGRVWRQKGVLSAWMSEQKLELNANALCGDPSLFFAAAPKVTIQTRYVMLVRQVATWWLGEPALLLLASRFFRPLVFQPLGGGSSGPSVSVAPLFGPNFLSASMSAAVS